jgi:23S rRNA G2445 N2-methylase RlmL
VKPYYADDAVTIYHGDCREILPVLEAVDHLITDPPYGEHVHSKQWIGHALTAAGDKRTSTAFTALGFDSLTPELRSFVAAEAKRLTRRWSLIFTDLEGITAWRTSSVEAGLDYVRAAIWDKVDSAI